MAQSKPGALNRPVYPDFGEEYDGHKLRQMAESLRLRDQTSPVVPISKGWVMTNKTIDRVLNADSTSTAELADVLATLIDDLKAAGYLAGNV